MNKMVWISVLTAVLITACVATFLLWSSPPLTEAEAIKIAQKHINQKYHDRFDRYSCDAELLDDVWIVAYRVPSADDTYILGGGTPEVRINAKNGWVMHCLLQK